MDKPLDDVIKSDRAQAKTQAKKKRATQKNPNSKVIGRKQQ